jgi:hypothetical protein
VPPPHFTAQKFSGLTLSADGHELDALAGDEVERLVDVGNLVEPHLAAVWKSSPGLLKYRPGINVMFLEKKWRR